MKSRFFLTTALGLILGSAAWAQSPSTPSGSTSSSDRTQMNSSTTNSQNSTSSQNSASGSTAAQSQPAPSGTSSTPSQAQSSTPSQGSASTSSASTSTSNNAPTNNQAQQQTPAANTQQNQAQQAPAGQSAPQNQAQQPAANQGTQASQPAASNNVSASANVSEQQRTRISQTFSRLNVQPVTNVNFSLNVGTVVPRDVRLQPLPAEIVEVVPQYRGYSFFAVRDEIVIVEPSSQKIVMVLPRSGGSSAAATTKRKVTFSDRDREVIRKHARSRSESRTTGSSSASIRIGERLPDSVEIRSFPEEIYRDAPTLRQYRYIERGPRTYVVEPEDRTVIEEID